MITLLVILICLGLDYGLNVNSRYRPLGWFASYEHTILGWSGEWVRSQPWAIIVALLLPVVLVLGLLQWLTCLSRVTCILFSIAVLWASLGTCEWRDMVLNYVRPAKTAKSDVDVSELLSDGHVDDTTVISQENTVGNKLKDAVFWQAHEQVFGVVFWFVILGPIGAGLYRFIWLMCHRSASDVVSAPTAAAIEQVHGVVAWLPARITALTYCLVGNWHPSWGAWVKNALRPGFSSGLLVECGNLAIETTSHNEKQKVKAALSLVTRTMIAWLLLLLLVVVLS